MKHRPSPLVPHIPAQVTYSANRDDSPLSEWIATVVNCPNEALSSYTSITVFVGRVLLLKYILSL